MNDKNVQTAEVTPPATSRSTSIRTSVRSLPGTIGWSVCVP